MSWRVHPAADRRGTALVVALAIVALSVLAGLWMHGAYWGLFAGLVLFLSLEAFFLPTRYTVGAEGIVVRKVFSRTERAWSTFRSAWFDPQGVTLSPFGRRHWLEAYRGVRVRWSHATTGLDRAGVEALLCRHLDPESVLLRGLTDPARGAQTEERP